MVEQNVSGNGTGMGHPSKCNFNLLAFALELSIFSMYMLYHVEQFPVEKSLKEFSAVTLHASMRGRIFQSESVEFYPAGWCLLRPLGYLGAQELTTTQHGIVLKKVMTKQAVGIRGVLPGGAHKLVEFTPLWLYCMIIQKKNEQLHDKH